MPHKDKDARNAYQRKKYAENPEPQLEKQRTPESRAKQKAALAKRMTDPEYVAKKKAQQKAWAEAHKKERAEYMAQWRKDNSERTKAQNAERMAGFRDQVLKHYSGDPPYCAYCGETWEPCLEIDHMDGQGHKTDKRTATKGQRYNRSPRQIVNAGFPKGLQILCGSCNRVKGTKSDQEFRRLYPKRCIKRVKCQ